MDPDRIRAIKERRALREARRLMADMARLKELESRLDEDLLTEWERIFQKEVPERLLEHGAAFFDPAKGTPGDITAPLSRLQLAKIRQIRRLVKKRLKAAIERQGSLDSPDC